MVMIRQDLDLRNLLRLFEMRLNLTEIEGFYRKLSYATEI